MDKPNIKNVKLGQVVLSKQGKDQGRFYVIVGFAASGPDSSSDASFGASLDLKNARVALADGERFNTLRPKLKNPAHIQPTSCIATSLLPVIECGRNIDRGHLVKILREHFKKQETGMVNAK